MRLTWLIARHDVSRALRERATLLWIFIMPPIFFYFIGTVTGGMAAAPQRPGKLVYEVHEDAGFLGQRLAVHLEKVGFELVPAGGEETAKIRLTVPAEFTENLMVAEPVILQLETDSSNPAAELTGFQVKRAAYTVLAEVLAANSIREAESAAGSAESISAEAAAGEVFAVEDFEEIDQMPRAMTLEVKAAGQRQKIPSGFEQAIPGNLVMFILMVMLTSGAVLLVAERRQGLLRRLASAPMQRRQIVLGKWAGQMVLGVIQITFAVVAGTVLFRMDWGPHFWLVIFVLLAWGGFCASLALLLGNVGSTEGQVIGTGMLTTMLLAAFGGCWWPIEITPFWMQTLQKFLPSGWVMDALHRLISFGDGPERVLPHLIALLVGTVVLGWIAARRFRFE